MARKAGNLRALKIALRAELISETTVPPLGGVGISNPSYWGMECSFRKKLFDKFVDLKPHFIRFPGGCFVEGVWLRNAFRWKKTIGSWEERPEHFGDVWNYWSDDELGYSECLQLTEDLDALPVWVVNNGMSLNGAVSASTLMPFVQKMLDGIEFARGTPNTTWGSVRAIMGHLEPFNLRYVAIGNEECEKKYYHGNYIKFHAALKNAHSDIKVVTN